MAAGGLGPSLQVWLGTWGHACHGLQLEVPISKPGYYYDTIMTFWINYIHYDTIMTPLLHYYDTLWQNPGKHYYYTYEISIIAIMTFPIYDDTYGYYDTMISIIAFWILQHSWHWGTIIGYYDNCETLCALWLLSQLP